MVATGDLRITQIFTRNARKDTIFSLNVRNNVCRFSKSDTHAAQAIVAWSSLHAIQPSPAPPTFLAPCVSYQLAFFTPGIRPLLAISRNWMRLIPNIRM